MEPGSDSACQGPAPARPTAAPAPPCTSAKHPAPLSAQHQPPACTVRPQPRTGCGHTCPVIACSPGSCPGLSCLCGCQGGHSLHQAVGAAVVVQNAQLLPGQQELAVHGCQEGWGQTRLGLQQSKGLLSPKVTCCCHVWGDGAQEVLKQVGWQSLPAGWQLSPVMAPNIMH